MAVCVCVSGRARRASGSVCQFSEVMNESGCVCANVYCNVGETKNKVPSLSIIGGRFIPTVFRPISRPTAGQSEGCYPRENIQPGGNVSPVLHDQERCNTIIKKKCFYIRMQL